MQNLKEKTYPSSYSMALSFVFFVILFLFNYLLFDLKLIKSFDDIKTFDLILISLTTFRLVRLFVYDSVAQYIRDWFLELKEVKVDGKTMIERNKPQGGLKRLMTDLLGCPWCASVWIAMFATFVYLFLPGLYFAYLVFAISGIASFIQISINRIGWQAEYKKTLTLKEQNSSSRTRKGSCNS
ncbi:hypothetical protein CL656_06580 [bacterium]|nr:hypothetical protein [bacterium]|tara:strand:- start:5612 stop:6160 length:549 start_codon:yes stop_codon:yes gene_type:complete